MNLATAVADAIEPEVGQITSDDAKCAAIAELLGRYTYPKTQHRWPDGWAYEYAGSILGTYERAPEGSKIRSVQMAVKALCDCAGAPSLEVARKIVAAVEKA